MSQGAPAFGTTEGHGAAGISAFRQNQTGVPIGCPVGQIAHGGPGGNGGVQLHGVHEQAAVSPDRQTSVVSLHIVPP